MVFGLSLSNYIIKSLLLICFWISVTGLLHAEEGDSYKLLDTYPQFNDEEKEWLNAGHVLSLPFVYFPPYYISVEDKEGIACEYISGLLDDIGVKYKYIDYKDIASFLNVIQSGSRPFLLPITTRDYALQEYYFNTDYWLVSEMSLFMNSDNELMYQTVDDFSSLTIAVINDVKAYSTLLNAEKPPVLFIVKSIQEGFETLQKGKVDAFAVDKLTGLYYSKKYKIKNISVRDVEGVEESYFFTAVSKEQPVLFSIITKAMKCISAEKLSKINRKYILDLESQDHLSFEDIARYLFIPLLVFAVALVILLFKLFNVKKKLHEHTLSLEEQVGARTIELLEKNQELELALEKVEKAQAQLINAEKMSVLGQLVAGIAHEINSPLGAIASARESLGKHLPLYLDRSISLAQRTEKQDGELVRQFMELASRKAADTMTYSSRERREARNNLTEKLGQLGVENNDDIARRLIDMNVKSDIERFIPLFKRDDIDDILTEVYAFNEIFFVNHTIKLAVDRISKVIIALSSYVRRDHTSDSSPGFDKVDIKDSIETVLVLFHNAIKQFAQINLDISDDLPDIWGDIDALNQVWSNLIKNALQALPGRGTITISVKPHNGGVEIVFADNGCGMTAEVKARIFEPLFTTKPLGQGTGLGMDIVRRIIEVHNGTIGIESEENAGTMIIIWLPANTPENL